MNKKRPPVIQGKPLTQQKEDNIKRNGQTETRRSTPPHLHKNNTTINIFREIKRNEDRHKDYSQESRTEIRRKAHCEYGFEDEYLKK